MNRNVLLFGMLGLSALTACETVIDLDPGQASSQIVIEGTVTDRTGKQQVIVTRSVAYGDKNSYPAVTGASVKVTDDIGGAWTFTETQPGIYSSSTLRAAPGRTYTLTVTVGNDQYTAKSTMPQRVVLDSISIKAFDFGGDNNRQVQAHYHDPAGVANQYRYIVKVDNKQEKAVFAENDRFTDGNKVTSVLFYPNEEEDDTFKLKSGSKIEVEFQCIDLPVFTYWFTLMQQSQNGPGGGTIPGNPPSNLSNGALGYFSAHTSDTRTLTVK